MLRETEKFKTIRNTSEIQKTSLSQIKVIVPYPIHHVGGTRCLHCPVPDEHPAFSAHLHKTFRALEYQCLKESG